MAQSRSVNVIIFGGCGFIGRHMVSFMVQNDNVSYIRVVDKVPPQVAWLNEEHSEAMRHPKVEFKSANLINEESVKTSLEGVNFDYAFNCAGETKLGQTDPVYKEGIYKVSYNCASASCNNGVKRFIEISSGQVTNTNKVACKESDKVEPWTIIAKYKLQAEEVLSSIPGLKYTIIRPGIIYGIGDKNGLCPRLILGGIYKYLNESLKLLWDRKLKMNTVHVDDVVRAAWHLCQSDDTISQVYNLVDDGDTTQGSLSDIISDIFNINHDYVGNFLSTIAKTDIHSVVDEVNDKHLCPWAEVCNICEIENTPLSPYIHQELLINKHLYLDNSKIKSTGFCFSKPCVTKDLLLEILNDYVEMKLFPKILFS